MYDEKIEIKLKEGFQKIADAILYLYDEAPEDDRYIKVELQNGHLIYNEIAECYFDALVALRIKLEEINIQILCKGATINVYPSPMQRNMGNGRKAYKLYMKQQAKMENVVDIFEPGVENECVSVTKQKEFYDLWLSSLKG